jgi:metal-dependent amidase/aminoacylase/carboxypeptidase family protein
MRLQLHEKIRTKAETIAMKSSGMCKVNILVGYPVLINDEPLTTKAKAFATDYLGAENMIEIPVRMGSEDFAYYTHQVPACFYRLGVGNFEKGITSSIHTPTFNIDEEALKDSIGLMSWLALNS